MSLDSRRSWRGATVYVNNLCGGRRRATVCSIFPDGRVRVRFPLPGNPEWIFPASDVFTDPAARFTDPITSHLAVEDIRDRVAGDRLRVLLAHRAHPAGLTDFELGAILGRQQTSVGKRRLELERVGLICARPGVRRDAPSGSRAQVWQITNAGRDATSTDGVTAMNT